MDFSSLSGKQLVKGQEARALGPRETDMSSVTCVQSKAGRAALTSLREPRLRIPTRCALDAPLLSGRRWPRAVCPLWRVGRMSRGGPLLGGLWPCSRPSACRGLCLGALCFFFDPFPGQLPLRDPFPSAASGARLRTGGVRGEESRRVRRGRGNADGVVSSVASPACGAVGPLALAQARLRPVARARPLVRTARLRWQVRSPAPEPRLQSRRLTLFWAVKHGAVGNTGHRLPFSPVPPPVS